MFLRDQVIDDDDGVVDRVLRARGLSNNDGGVGIGKGIDDASNGLKTTTEFSVIQGRKWRLKHRDDEPEELATTTKALAEEDDPEFSTTTTEASAEEA